MGRSRWIIPLMFALAAAFGVASVAFHHSISQRAIASWGPPQVALLIDAPRVEALELQPLADGAKELPPAEKLNAPEGNIEWRGADVADAAGIAPLRHALLEDDNYDWHPERPAPPEAWRFALVFADGQRQVTVYFDFAAMRMARSDGSAALGLAPRAASWQNFFRDVFADSARR